MVDRYDEVLRRHQIVLECIPCESETQTGLCLQDGDQGEVEREREREHHWGRITGWTWAFHMNRNLTHERPPNQLTNGTIIF